MDAPVSGGQAGAENGALTVMIGGDEKDFERVVQYIRDNGVSERFFSKSFIYFYMGGWKYWTMGEPLNETQVINRASA